MSSLQREMDRMSLSTALVVLSQKGAKSNSKYAEREMQVTIIVMMITLVQKTKDHPAVQLLVRHLMHR